MSMDTLEKKSFEVVGPIFDGAEQILTHEALEFVCMLQNKYGDVRLDLLKKRVITQNKIDSI